MVPLKGRICGSALCKKEWNMWECWESFLQWLVNRQNGTNCCGYKVGLLGLIWSCVALVACPATFWRKRASIDSNTVRYIVQEAGKHVGLCRWDGKGTKGATVKRSSREEEKSSWLKGQTGVFTREGAGRQPKFQRPAGGAISVTKVWFSLLRVNGRREKKKYY